MKEQVYERVFSSRFSKYNISILLSESIQKKIASFFKDNDEAYKVRDDILKFLNDNNIPYDKDYIPEKDTYIQIFFDFDKPLSDKEMNKIQTFIDNKNYNKYIEKFIDIYLMIKINTNISIIDTIRYDYYPEGLLDYLSNLEKDLIITVNEVINSSFSEYFYPVKEINIRAWIQDDHKASANFILKPKIKSDDIMQHANELSDVLEKEF